MTCFDRTPVLAFGALCGLWQGLLHGGDSGHGGDPGETAVPVIALANGDANGDLARDLSDGIYLLSHLFHGGPAPAPLALCAGDEPAVASGDVNGDGGLDVSDPVHLLRWLHSGGPAPVDACSAERLAGAGGHAGRIPLIVPPRLFPGIYSLLAGKWWLWAFAPPLGAHPLFDETGALCDAGQAGPFWYLGGSFVSGVVERTCTVPQGKLIFLPLLNTECSSLEPEPFACTSTSECLACNAAFYSPGDELALEIDGVSVPDLHRFRARSRLFPFTLGEDSIFGLPAGTTGVSLADGYHILLAPLARGEHTIRWSGRFAGGALAGFGGEVTYHLTVE